MSEIGRESVTVGYRPHGHSAAAGPRPERGATDILPPSVYMVNGEHSSPWHPAASEAGGAAISF
jgi:hypothetical protein